MIVNEDYGYCTAQSGINGELCPLRNICKRYDEEALESDLPLWWTDGFYDPEKNKCDFIDLKIKSDE